MNREPLDNCAEDMDEDFGLSTLAISAGYAVEAYDFVKGFRPNLSDQVAAILTVAALICDRTDHLAPRPEGEQ